VGPKAAPSPSSDDDGFHLCIRPESQRNLGSLVICVTRVFSRISLIFKRIVNIPRGQAGYVGTGDLDSKYRSSVA
jgi:hypothetical protein